MEVTTKKYLKKRFKFNMRIAEGAYCIAPYKDLNANAKINAKDNLQPYCQLLSLSELIVQQTARITPHFYLQPNI